MNGAGMQKRRSEYASEVTLGCVNFRTTWGDKAANLSRMTTMIHEAAERDIDILAFPELALTGYECGGEPCRHEETAETIPGPATEEIASLARSLNMYIVFGMVERDRSDPSHRFIACAVVGPNGLLGSYRKLHLGPPPLFNETRCFRPGTSVPVFDTAFGPIGVQICADFWMYPEVARLQMLKGARIIINCSGSPDLSEGRQDYMTQQTGARATENLVYTASSNLVGTEREVSFYGCSTIAGPAYPRFNYIYAQAGREEEIISARLSFDQLEQIRSAVPVESIRNSDVILAEFNALDREGRPAAHH